MFRRILAVKGLYSKAVDEMIALEERYKDIKESMGKEKRCIVQKVTLNLLKATGIVRPWNEIVIRIAIRRLVTKVIKNLNGRFGHDWICRVNEAKQFMLSLKF